MTTYQVQINEQHPLGKSIIALLQSANEQSYLLLKREKEANRPTEK